MMGFGFLSMLLVIALPIVGIVALVVWLSNANRQGNPFDINLRPVKQNQADSLETNHYCSNCGTGLQKYWTHCPHCGAAVTA